MNNEQIKRKKQCKNTESAPSPERRAALKKAAYVAPALLVYGALRPMKAAGDLISGVGPPPDEPE